MKIAIFGTGYVGLVTGACLADKGHSITCIDIDEKKVSQLKTGTPHFYEPGLADILKRNLKANRISFTTQPDIKDAQVIFIAVGTPQGADGSANLQYVFDVAETIATHCQEGQVIVTKSTVPVKTASLIESILKGKGVHVASNPETLREGSAVKDFMHPDRVIVGARHKTAFKALREVYSPFLIRDTDRILEMSPESAELVKYGANAMLAMRISFINLLSQIAANTGADIRDVRKGVGSDYRIGKHFLYPGPGFGGSCFPKDVSALSFQAREAGVDPALIDATLATNTAQQHYITRLVLNAAKQTDTVAVWGLAFKANTDDARDSPAIFVAKQLLKAQNTVLVHDPQATKNFLKEVPQVTPQDRLEMLQQAGVLVIMTEWDEYRTLSGEELQALKGKTIVDARNILARPAELDKLKEHDIAYVGVGVFSE